MIRVLIVDDHTIFRDGLKRLLAEEDDISVTGETADASEALSLLRNLHQRFPQYPQIPRAYLLAARGFAEGLGQLEPAGKLLAFIRQRYPDTPLLAEVASLEQVLEKMARQGG